MAPSAVSLKNRPSGKTVAIVEDEAVLSRVLEVKLKRAGFNTILAADGEEASRIIRDDKPDLVLLDLVMPKKDGFQVLREMRDKSETEHTPVMILSNHGSDEDRLLGKKYQVCDYLIKSTTKLNTVVDKVESFLGHESAIDKRKSPAA